MTTRTAPRPFTGWHMTGILVSFFLVVMAVNFAMAKFALSSFGGTVVDNSYVASQHYNELLAKAEAQDRLGWQPSVWLDRTRHVRVTLAHQGERLPIASAKAMIHHPLGRLPSQALVMVGDGQGGMISTRMLPQGRWRIELAVTHGGDEARYRRNLK